MDKEKDQAMGASLGAPVRAPGELPDPAEIALGLGRLCAVEGFGEMPGADDDRHRDRGLVIDYKDFLAVSTGIARMEGKLDAINDWKTDLIRQVAESEKGLKLQIVSLELAYNERFEKLQTEQKTLQKQQDETAGTVSLGKFSLVIFGSLGGVIAFLVTFGKDIFRPWLQH